MNKIKKISVFLLLLIMTVCIVFLPKLISGQNEGSLRNKKIYWNYDMRSSTKITSKQVAKLYYNHEINIGTYNSILFDEENYNESLMQEKALALFEIVFESNETICEHIKMIITNGSPRYSQSSTLTKIDNQPFALNFINVIIITMDGVLEFTYEEKTKTLISFSHYSSLYYLDYKYEDKSFVDSLELMVKNYYKNQLGIGINEYYFLNESVDKFDRKNYCTEFGILQQPTNIKGKFQE